MYSLEPLFPVSMHYHLIYNKTGLQPVSRPVEQIVGFFHKDLKRGQKTVQTNNLEWSSLHWPILCLFYALFVKWSVTAKGPKVCSSS